MLESDNKGSIPHPVREDYPRIVFKQEKVELKPKTLIVSTVHYRGTDGVAKSIVCRAGRNLESKDDPIIRTIEVGEEWQELDSAWIKSIGYLFLRNDGGIKFQVVPTEEQLKEMHSQIVEIGYVQSTLVDCDNGKEPINNRTMWDAPISSVPKKDVVIEPFWLVHLNECHQGKPIKGKSIYLRCQHGTTKVMLMIHPN